MHQISVTGDLESFLPKLILPDNITAETERNTVYFSSSDRNELDKFKENLINPIAHTIKTHYKNKLISRELCCMEQLFSEDEITAAADYVKKHTLTDGCINGKLKKFFSESDSLSIDGFINFRLTAFKNEISNLSAYISERMLSERECEDFWGLLKEFTALREPLFDVLHIVVAKCGGYYIFDEALRDITAESAKSVAASFMYNEISFDDMVLYILLTFAPKKTVIHGARHIKCARLTEAVKTIFGGRAEFCGGCPLCFPYLK